MPDTPHIKEASPFLAGSESGYDSSLEAQETFDFEHNADPANPLEWSDSYKWGIVILLSFMGFIVYELIKFPVRYLTMLIYPAHLHASQ